MSALTLVTHPHRPFRQAAAWVVLLLLLLSTLAGCGPSSVDGCRRATSSFLLGDFRGAAATLTGPRFHLQPKPADDNQRVFNCTKQRSPQWKKLKNYGDGIKTNGKSGKKALYYEWDNRHNDIEVYGPAPNYKHLGSMDPIQGEIYKDPVKGRNLKDKLK